MTSTHASSTDIALTEQAGEGASSGGMSAGGDQADQAAAVDMPEAGIELDLFGEKIVPAKTPRRQRSPKGNGAPQPSAALPPASAEVDPESTRPRPTEGPTSVLDTQTAPAAAEVPGGQRPENGASDKQVDGQSESPWTSVSTYDLRGDDVKIQSFESLVEKYPKDLKIYLALLRLADDQKKGTRVDDETWRIGIGYSEISKESGCCKRALGRAWPRLARLGVVLCIKKHADRCENLYLVRAPEWLERMYKESGCTHYRVLPNGVIQPFRPRSEGEK